MTSLGHDELTKSQAFCRWHLLHFLWIKFRSSHKTLLKFTSEGSVTCIKPALLQVMAWQTGESPYLNPWWSCSLSFFFKVFICHFLHILWAHYLSHSQYLHWEPRGAITPTQLSSTVLESVNMTLPMPPLTTMQSGWQLRTIGKKKFTWMHHIYSKNGKRGKKLHEVYRPGNCRASTFITGNNQSRGCRCRYKVHTWTELMRITVNGNHHDNNYNSNLMINQLLMNSICWIMQCFNITLNNCSIHSIFCSRL